MSIEYTSIGQLWHNTGVGSVTVGAERLHPRMKISDVEWLVSAHNSDVTDLREAWQQAKAEKAAATAENARLQARVAELEEALAEWYLASDDYAEGAETAAHDRLNELAAECAAKQEAKP